MEIKRALLSVSDKTGIVELARALSGLGIEIISTGGTMKTIKEAGIPVTYVSEVTGFPEIMDGRVKTLNPFIHGGILARRDNPDHIAAMAKHGIRGIDMVVVNLYPFRQTIAKPDVTLNDAIENIDIGGPAMIRAAAKNFQYVTVVVNPSRYPDVLRQLEATGMISSDLRMGLAQEAFLHTAEYDAYIARYLGRQLGETEFPVNLQLAYEKIQDLRYGENPHQQAAFYRQKHFDGPGVATAKQLSGKELSFNNIVDVEAAYSIVAEFQQPAATIIKHTNPCGMGIGPTIAEAYAKAYAADPVSAFGGIVGLNRQVDRETAEKINEIFVEVVIAPAFSDEAVSVLTQKKNIRLLAAGLPQTGQAGKLDIKPVSGGILLQDADITTATQEEMQVVTKRRPTAAEWEQLLFAWKVVKHVKSNAIVIAGNSQTLGVGAGQMNRVGAAEIALAQAGDAAKGAVLASDAFFPFADTVEAAAQAGITAIIQPGGSLKDEDSITVANQYSITMVFTGVRHFKH
ncbi:MAG TPA: bifunctional phosphoribosylaminoimidazolecarboxamide formyltransferase/IMP cyclohydrolase [Methylomusa anaerophila]|uniref:Bifunctional purine biosynthesis protein PurH n=1 Tax=Methylomusa anaerophila TaxID=1930071 RepID=A0A348AMP2_9FIRM|nr:bifunctional phosphoribosylaminoimidazolecarboxamide formyltransferase/IMP cyclohydrolase [Methylomusa anaerophila]BBB92340.1 bifunctional purine biosynthesis protein PurH [Methylomusa anaerophila]HML90021.1 bifunctional phosphoribosylaminoimidazolecarboxamide formyltransferase/IMP cyclohydrolase [Methylomusa anaerophila]